MQEAETVVDGRPVRSRSTGVLAGLPEVVIVPGLGAPSYVEPWAREMGCWTRATILDLPGWRGGRGRASPATVEGVARATSGWLRATDARNVVLIGHSSGSQSALRTALEVPDRLAGLVLGGPTLEPAARRPATLMVRFFRTVVHEKWSEVPSVVPWHLRGGFGWLRLVRSLVRDRPEDVAGAVDLPVLVLTGAEDRFAPPAWAEHLAGLTGGRYATMSGAHNFCFTAPRSAADAVRGAVQRWTTAAGSHRRHRG